MGWTPKQVDRLILEMAAQAQASSWSDRHAADRTRVRSEVVRRYGWIRRDQHAQEVANTAWMIAMHAAGNRGLALRLHTLGCLFAETHAPAPGRTPSPGSDHPRRRTWFGLWRKPKSPEHTAPLPNTLVLREQFARLL